MKKSITLLLLILLTFFKVLFGTDVSGEQSGEWFADNNPYNVVDNIVITNSLIIHPGVEIIFTGNYYIKVTGYIKALGTQNDSINFTSDQTWDEIRLENQELESRFEYCNIQNAVTGINSLNSPLFVCNSTIKNTEKAINIFGVGYQNPATVHIKKSIIKNCEKQGIFIVENSNTIIDSCDISYCALSNQPYGAIQVSNQSETGQCNPSIFHCLIHNNVWQGITAFDITGNQNIYITAENNLITQNLTGIYLLYATGYFNNNTITFNYVSGNSNSGAGIMIAGSSNDVEAPIFTNNVISGNFTGFYITNNGKANLGNIINYTDIDDGENYIYDNVDETGTTYSVYNTSSFDIFAQNNHWDSENDTQIAETIIDFYDNPSYGEVIFVPTASNDSNQPSIISNNDNILVYPNPLYVTKNHKSYVKLYIKNNYKINSLEIYNLKGEKIYKKNVNRNLNEIALNTFLSYEGIYLIRIKGDKKEFIKKLTVIYK